MARRRDRPAAVAAACGFGAALLVLFGIAGNGMVKVSLESTKSGAARITPLRVSLMRKKSGAARITSPTVSLMRTKSGVARQHQHHLSALSQNMDKEFAGDLHALANGKHTQLGVAAVAATPPAKELTESLNVENAMSPVFAGTAAVYGADGGGSGWKPTPVSAQDPAQASAQYEDSSGFVCYDPNGCDAPANPTETKAEAVAEAFADDPSYYGDNGVDDQEEGSPGHAGTPYRGSYMHATFPYEKVPTGFFAGHFTRAPHTRMLTHNCTERRQWTHRPIETKCVRARFHRARRSTRIISSRDSAAIPFATHKALPQRKQRVLVLRDGTFWRLGSRSPWGRAATSALARS